MTIIAYRDGVLASDSLIVECDTAWAHTKKIIKTSEGYLAGACGDLSFLREFLDWVQLEDRYQYKAPKFSDANQALIVQSKQIVHFYCGKNPTLLSVKYIAIGNGCDIALGAFWKGANAHQAVEAAIAHNVNCGGNIDTLEL